MDTIASLSAPPSGPASSDLRRAVVRSVDGDTATVVVPRESGSAQRGPVVLPAGHDAQPGDAVWVSEDDAGQLVAVVSPTGAGGDGGGGIAEETDPVASAALATHAASPTAHAARFATKQDALTGVADVPGLSASLSGKQDTLADPSDVPGLTAALAGKQDDLTGTSDVPGLTTALAGKAPVSHTHPQSDVTGLAASLAAKQATLTGTGDVPGLTTALAGKSPVGHAHVVADVTDFWSRIRYYGSGADGALVFDGSSTVAGLVPSGSAYTMTRDLHSTAMTIQAGVTVRTNGFLPFVRGVLTIDGTLSGTGSNGNANGTVGGVPAGRATNQNGGIGNATAGATGSAGALGGASGAGGSGGGGTNAGGAAVGSVLTSAQAQALAEDPFVFRAGTFAWNITARPVTGGAGGGGGGGDGTNKGGGSGAGGQALILYAQFIVVGVTGTITVRGGDGGSPVTGNAGGGGPGGGGIVLAYTLAAWTQSGSIVVAAGTAGSGVGTGATATAGAAGWSKNVVLA